MCGIIGAIRRTKAVNRVARGLYALQHRGHDSCGIAWLGAEGHMEVLAGRGAVADVLPDERTDGIDADAAMGQNLYTTYGTSHSTQPFCGRFWDARGRRHQVAVSHNGQLCRIGELRRKYPVMYSSHSDSEIVFALLPHMAGSSMRERILALLRELEGAYCLLFLTDEGLVAARDPHGFRPLAMGRDADGAVYFASEINAFDLMGADYVRDVEPGEMIVVGRDGRVDSTRFRERAGSLAQCVFEHIYFARPDNRLFGKPGYATQQELGRQAARELKGRIDADLVMPVPDSANVATLGFSKEYGLPLEIGLLRHHFSARTFIMRGQHNREEAVRLKFNVVKHVVRGNRIILGDDSLVRATTSRIIVSMLRESGAKEIHLVLFSPPIAHPCVYGINMPTPGELVANRCRMDLAAIARVTGADSVHYLSLDGLRRVMGETAGDYCYACMDGRYPVEAGESEPQVS